MERESSGLIIPLQGHQSHQGASTLMTSSKANYLPKALSPITITLEIGFQHTVLRDTYIQTVTASPGGSILPAVLVFCSCYNKLPYPGWLKATEMITSQFWCPEVQNQQGSPGGSRKNLPCLFQPPVALGVPCLCQHHSNLYLQLSHHLLLCVSLLCVWYEDTCPWIRTHPDNPG